LYANLTAYITCNSFVDMYCTVGVRFTSDTLVLRVRAGGCAGWAIRIKHTGYRVDALVSISGIAHGLGGFFGSSPLGDWAIGVGVALYAATTFKLAVWGTSILAVRVTDTEVYADTSQRIAVAVWCGCKWRSIDGGTALRGVESSSAILARSISHAVGSGGRAIVVGLAGSANSVASASGLEWDDTTISGLTIGIGFAVGASSVLVTVLVSVVPKVNLTSNVVGVSTTNTSISTEPWVNTFSGDGITDRVGSRWWGSIRGSTPGVAGTSGARSVGVTVRSRGTARVSTTFIVVGVAGKSTQSVDTEGSANSVSVPSISSLAISIAPAIEANSILHAVGSLSSRAVRFSGTSSNAKSAGKVAVDLSFNLTSIRGITGRSSIVDGTWDTSTGDLTI